MFVEKKKGGMVVPTTRLTWLPVQEANAQSGKETDPAEWLGPGKQGRKEETGTRELAWFGSF